MKLRLLITALLCLVLAGCTKRAAWKRAGTEDTQ